MMRKHTKHSCCATKPIISLRPLDLTALRNNKGGGRGVVPVATADSPTALQVKHLWFEPFPAANRAPSIADAKQKTSAGLNFEGSCRVEAAPTHPDHHPPPSNPPPPHSEEGEFNKSLLVINNNNNGAITFSDAQYIFCDSSVHFFLFIGSQTNYLT